MVKALEKYSASRNQVLDAVRGLAVVQIVVWHIFTPFLAKNAPIIRDMVNLTWSGVDLFFVLSGYLLGGILIRNRESTYFYSAFYGRRFLRILPLYWICISLYLIVLGPAESIWPYLTFTQNFVWGLEGHWGPYFVNPTWSLAVEEQFYLLLPFLIRACPARTLPAALVALIVTAPVFRAIAILADYPYGAYMFMPCRMDSLFLGVLLSWAMVSAEGRKFLWRLQPAIWLIVVGTGGLLISALFLHLDVLSPVMVVLGYSIIAVFYTAFLALLLTKEVSLLSALRPLSYCGVGAYSIYLFHRPLGISANALFGHHLMPLLALCSGTVIVAVACWWGIEAPLIALGHRWFCYGGETDRRTPMGAIDQNPH